jgi:hypothetical protein
MMPFITLGIFFISFAAPVIHSTEPSGEAREVSDSLKKAIAPFAEVIMTALKAKDMEALSVLIHPEKGVRFSPYGFVGKADKRFDAASITGEMKDKKTYFWGFYDATRKPIKKTFKDYFKRFVYDRDFQKANFIAYNHIQRTDKDVNVFDFYKDCVVIDYMYTGEPEFMDLGWRSKSMKMCGILSALYTMSGQNNE